MSYLPPPIWLNYQGKENTKKVKPKDRYQLITIETRRPDGSTYLATIYPPSKVVEPPKCNRSFMIRFLYLIEKSYKIILSK